jgi:hypothetical protein
MSIGVWERCGTGAAMVLTQRRLPGRYHRKRARASLRKHFIHAGILCIPFFAFPHMPLPWLILVNDTMSGPFIKADIPCFEKIA